MDMKECRKKFDAIVEGRENEGYIEWKKWVVEQIKEYDVIRLTNSCKRCEIALKKLSYNDGFRVSNIITQILSYLFVILPIFVSTIFTVFGILSSVYQESLEKSVMREYASLVNDTITELNTGMLSAIVFVVVIAFVMLPIGGVIDAKINDKKSNDKILYEELFKILKKRLRKLKDC